MTPDIFNTAKNLFIIFPPGCGGNHLANMLSMNPLFSQRFTGMAYKNRMVSKYRARFAKPNGRIEIAHFGYLENLHRAEILKNNQHILSNSTTNIWCSHYDEYFRNAELLDMYSNKIFFIMSYPLAYTVAHHRMNTGVWINGVTRDRENSYSYSSSGFIKPTLPVDASIPLLHVSNPIPDEIFEINTDIFFTHFGYDYLIHILKSSLGIDLPKECDELHSLWLESVISSYKKVDN